jgi:H+/Cl- antiporter ClcA
VQKRECHRNDDRNLIRVVKFSSGFGLGTMAAFLYSVKQVNPVLRYEISGGTGVSFALAVALSWAFWRLVFGRQNDLNARVSTIRRRWLWLLSLVLVLCTVAPFVYALKGVGNDKAKDIAEGTAIALVALGGVGFLFWRVTRYLKADSERNSGPGDTPNRPHE